MNTVVVFIKGKEISLKGVSTWKEVGSYTGFLGAEKVMWFPTSDIEGFMQGKESDDSNVEATE